MERKERIAQAVDKALAPLDDGFDIKDIWDVCTLVMEDAEEWVGLATGEDKKAFVLEVVDVALQRVDLPGPDWATRQAVMWLLPSLIDKFVDLVKEIPNFGTSTEAP